MNEWTNYSVIISNGIIIEFLQSTHKQLFLSSIDARNKSPNVIATKDENWRPKKEEKKNRNIYLSNEV